MGPTTPTQIIVPLDGGPLSERAIPVAAALAAQYSVPVVLMTVLSATDLPDNATMYLKSRAAELEGLQVTIDVAWGLPAVHTLVGYFENRPGSLVCCSTHARPESGRFMLGSVAEEMVRRSPLPIVLVGPRAGLPGPSDRYEDVVMCVKDDSAERMLPYVRDLAADLGLGALLIDVLEPSLGNDRRRREADELLERLRRQVTDAGVEAEAVLFEDRNVPLEIVTVARGRQAPLLALSARRRRAGERYEETSMTVAIARIASCPVLVVGPEVTARQTAD